METGAAVVQPRLWKGEWRVRDKERGVRRAEASEASTAAVHGEATATGTFLQTHCAVRRVVYTR
jgi:hypothetical protein